MEKSTIVEYVAQLVIVSSAPDLNFLNVIVFFCCIARAVYVFFTLTTSGCTY